jgi:hypothetical protein
MSELEYWESQPTDNPFYVNGFNGTWAFTDHNLIPNSLTNFIMASFPKIERFKRIPLEDINSLMNDVWEGPGSMVKVQKMYLDMRAKHLATLKSNGTTSKPLPNEELLLEMPDNKEED